MQTCTQDTPPPQEPNLFANDFGDLFQVLGALTSETIELFPQGGGFIRKLPRAEFERRFKPAQAPAFSLRAVSAEWLPTDMKLPAYTTGERWNGWAMPYFPEKTAHALLPHMPDLSYDATQDAFVSRPIDDENNVTVFPAQALVVNGEAHKVYAIGAGSWCWWLED